MTGREFSRIRKRLEKTQKDLSHLLGVSLQAVHSYEQGWRKVPPHAERQLLFLLAMKRGFAGTKPCWTVEKCPKEVRQGCPAWEFQAGHLCWFINGTLCGGEAETDWSRKMKKCRSCDAFRHMLSDE